VAAELLVEGLLLLVHWVMPMLLAPPGNLRQCPPSALLHRSDMYRPEPRVRGERIERFIRDVANRLTHAPGKDFDKVRDE